MSVVFLLHKTWWQFSDVLASYWGDEAYTYICIHIYIHTYIHTHNGILLHYKNNETMLFATTWMDLEISILSEVSQRKTNILLIVQS